MWRSRLGWAALASLLLHAVLLALLWDRAPVRPGPAPERSAPLVVEVITPPKPATGPEKKPAAAPEPVKPPRPPRAPPDKPQPPPRAPPPRAETPPEAPTKPPPDAKPSPPSAPGPDSPLTQAPRPNLMPTAPNGGWSLPGPPDGPKGRTLLPGDPSLSPEALAAEEHDRVQGRVEGFTKDKLAELRVSNGLVHPYFGQMRAALEKQLENAPLFGTPSVLQGIARNFRDEAARYGATGSPGGRPGPSPSANEKLSTLVDGEPAYEGLRARTQAGEELQKVADGKQAPVLLITLELEQAPDGTLRSARVTRTSGNAAFDAWVMERVPQALAKLQPPPPKAGGVRPDGIHSLWEVEGKVSYRRRLSELKKEDALYYAAMAAGGILGGSFDEVKGDVWVIDLRHPKFLTKPRLLRVY